MDFYWPDDGELEALDIPLAPAQKPIPSLLPSLVALETPKQCSRCGARKFGSEFGIRFKSPDKLASVCLECCKVAQRKYRERHRERINAAHRERRRLRKERIEQAEHEYLANNPGADHPLLQTK